MSGAPYENNSEFIGLDLERGRLHPLPLASPTLKLVHTYSIASLISCFLVSFREP